jgi:hypothetical protein
MGLAVAGATDEAAAESEGLITAVDATDNPAVLGYAFLARGLADRWGDGVAAYESCRRGLTIAQASGNRLIESHLASSLAQLAAAHGEPTDALDYLSLSIRHFLDSGSFSHLPVPLAVLASVFDRLARYEAAATVSGSAKSSLAQSAVPEIDAASSHLRESLGDEKYESLVGEGRNMTTAAAAQYALDQIDHARAQFE